MNEEELKSAIRSNSITHRFFRGIFARDELSDATLTHGFILVNTDKRKDEGTHWLLIYRNTELTIYFDSFGLPPIYEEFYLFIDSNFFYNKQQLQNETSALCGVYCLYFALQLCLGESLTQIRNRFVKNTYINDRIICSLFKKHFTYLPHNIGMKCIRLC